jgi:hypothetical protein
MFVYCSDINNAKGAIYMIVKINGTPVGEVVREGFNALGDGVKTAYGIIHTPLDVEVTTHAYHLINFDVNIFNIPHHAIALVKPHVVTAFEYLF